MVRLPATCPTVATPWLSRTIGSDQDFLAPEVFHSPSLTGGPVNEYTVKAPMESSAKQRTRSAMTRDSDHNASNCVRKCRSPAPIQSNPVDNRPMSCLRRSQSTKDEHLRPRSSATRKKRNAKEETEFQASQQEKEVAMKNVNSLFGVKAKKNDCEKDEKPKDNNPWSELEHHIRNIDLDTMHFQEKPFTETSSLQFKSVMGEMQGDIQQRHIRRKKSIHSLKMSIKFQGFKKNMADLKEAVQKQEEFEAKQMAKNVKKAPPGPKSRGWRILRNYIQEQRLEKQKNKNMGGWNLLTKTMKGLTDQEKARQDLYERYLYKPNAWTEGFSTLPQILVDRMKAREIPGVFSRPGVRERPHTAVGIMNTRRPSISPTFSNISNAKMSTSSASIGARVGKQRKLTRRPRSSIVC